MKTVKRIFAGFLICYLSFAHSGFAQHRGDNLAFQGLAFPNESGVRILAMGGAGNAISGDLAAVFRNPAGLADLDRPALSISANRYQKDWRENQVYRTNRFFLNLPFYLEGLYVPNPENNGQWDYEIFIRERDSTYQVQEPSLGNDPFGPEAADWQESADAVVFDHVAAALPLELGGKSLVVSGAYHRSHDVLDFDRNDTFLDPHPGYDEYGVAERVANDTLRMDWYRFERSRRGKLHSFTAAIAYTAGQRIKLGVGVSSFRGETEDAQILDKVGWFDLARNNRFRFSYDTLFSKIQGVSKFSGTRFSVGTVLSFERFRLGLKLSLPYTIERRWNYETTVRDTLQTLRSSSSGVDRMHVPAEYTLGFSLSPVRQFTFAFDYEARPYGRATFDLAKADSTHRNWVNQNLVRFGVEYRPFEWLALLAGYRELPAAFVPDGAALKDRGPITEGYTVGLSLDTGWGRLDLAYEIRQLKYYDSYYSNTNYVYESFKNLMFGYTFMF